MIIAPKRCSSVVLIVMFCGVQLGAISRRVPKILIHVMRLKMIVLKLLPHFQGQWVNSSPRGQNDHDFTNNYCRCIFVNEKFRIVIEMSLKFVPKGPIGFGDNTDLLWWNNVNNQFCQLTTRVSYQRGIRRPFKCTGNHSYWGLKNNRGTQSKNGLQNLWGNTVFFILC